MGTGGRFIAACGIVALALTQMGGCDVHWDDDLEITVVNNYSEDVWIEGDHYNHGWQVLAFVEGGEAEVIWLGEYYDGEELRAVDRHDYIVSRTQARDGLRWTISSGF